MACPSVFLIASLAVLATVAYADQSGNPIASMNYQANRKLVQEILDKEPVLYQEILGGQLTPTGIQGQPGLGGMSNSNMMPGANFQSGNLGQMGYGYPPNYNSGFMHTMNGAMGHPMGANQNSWGQQHLQSMVPGMQNMQHMQGMQNMQNMQHMQHMQHMRHMQTPNQFQQHQGMMNQMRSY